MQRKKLKKLKGLLEKEIKLTEKRLLGAKEAANETAKTARVSWSAAGDREYAQGQVEVIEAYFNRLQSLFGEIEKALKRPPPDTVETPSLVEIDLNGKTNEFYFVRESVNISGIKFLTPDSPLGKAILKMKAGDGFKFTLDKGNIIKGEIVEIE